MAAGAGSRDLEKISIAVIIHSFDLLQGEWKIVSIAVY